jgi:outer membrane protein TolC
MQKPSNQDSQRQNQREHQFLRAVNFLLLNVVVVLTVIVGTARILTPILKSQKILQPAVSVEPAVKPLIVQPVAGENIKHQSKDNQQLSKGEAIVLPLKNPLETSTEWERQQQTQSGKPTHYASRMPTANANPPIAPSQPQSQNNQLLLKSWKLNDATRSPSETLHSVESQVAFTSPSTSRSQKEPGNDRREALAIPTPEIRESVSRKAFPSSTRERDDTKKEDTRTQRPTDKGTSGHEERGHRDISASSRLPTPPNFPSKQETQPMLSRKQSHFRAGASFLASPSLSLSMSSQPLHHVFSQTRQVPQQNVTSYQNQISKVQQADRVTESSLKQSQQKPLPKVRPVALKLSDVVVFALQNNRSIKNAYLERIAQKQDLAVEENKFAPNLTPSVSMSMAQSGSDATTTTTNDVGFEAKMKIPTGGELSFGLTANALTPKITFNQPLLRGAGIDVNRASIKTARLTEKSNVLGLKSTLTNTMTDAIIAYRNLLRAQERVKIEQLSLKSAQELLEINRALIEAGRLAPVDIIQSQTAIANRQVSLVAAQNNLESTKLALLQILDIDQNTNILAAEVPKASPVTLDANKLRQLAFENQPEYLQAQLNLGKAKLDLLQAENNRRWDLGLNVSYDNTGDNATGDVRAGLTFSKTLGDLTPEQRFQRSRVNQLQAENNLKDQRESLEIQVTDRIRDANLSFSQVQLARQARESSERQLEIEREKQRLGRGSGVFEIVSLENSLVEARNAELNATIEYLNALTNLDKTVGTTLDTWQVTIEANKI